VSQRNPTSQEHKAPEKGAPKKEASKEKEQQKTKKEVKKKKGTRKNRKPSTKKEKPSSGKQKQEKKMSKEKIKLAVKTPSALSRPLPPIPKRKIPLIDPRLVSKESKKIVPEMGEGESVEISLDTTESKYISYFKHIRDKLYLVWRYPPEAAAAGIQGTVRILFVIERNGRLKEVKILESSGYPILDKEAVRAIIAASPFGPFPPDWTEKELRIRARFTYHLFSGSPF